MAEQNRAVVTACYLIVNSKGQVRVNKSKPSLDSNEVAIHLGIQLPEALFKRPLLDAKVIVGSEAVAPVEISPDVIVNTAAAIEQQTGMKVELTLKSEG